MGHQVSKLNDTPVSGMFHGTSVSKGQLLFAVIIFCLHRIAFAMIGNGWKHKEIQVSVVIDVPFSHAYSLDSPEMINSSITIQESKRS